MSRTGPPRKSEQPWDPAAPPLVRFHLWGHEHDMTVCDFRWWGPTEDWDVTGVVERAGARLQVRSFEVVPHVLPHGLTDRAESVPVAPGGVTPKLLRDVPLGRLMDQVHVALLAETRRLASGDGEHQQHARERWSRHAPALSPEGEPLRRPGRPPLADDLLFRLSVAYIEDTQGRGVTGRLAEQFDRPEATIRDWIRAARARGYLAAAEQGRRSAAPGPRLLDEVMKDWTGEEGIWPDVRLAMERGEL
ncbi:MAG: hypothetical protein JWP11_3429 [Frankiales bacterium]|nr:hypothetical protein [Frankiales bacterium]